MIALTLSASNTLVRADEPLDPWRDGVSVRLVADQPDGHTIHTYYLTCPESPDGTRVLYFASTTPEGHHGDLVVRERATGKETVIARDVETEDAHRAACQQWISGGRRVVYHDVKDGRWSVHVIDLETGTSRTLAHDRQLCFGPASGDVVPLYGCHWNPGAHRDLELLNVATGEITTALTIAEVEQRYGDWLTKQFGGRSTSIFFPNISPDGKRVFFKMAAQDTDGAAGIFRSASASDRQGLLVYDLATREPIWMRETWGHPAWHPDSTKIIEMGNILFDLARGGAMVRIPDLPTMRGCHPSLSPDGRLFVMDGLIDSQGNAEAQWAIVVCDVRGRKFQILHSFDNSRGAKSWRKNHPHPVFSPDGRRIYFNANDTDWTQLCVAEVQAER